MDYHVPLGISMRGSSSIRCDMAGEFMRVWADWTKTNPDAVPSMAAFLHTPDDVPVVGAFVACNDSEEDGAPLVAPLRALGTPALDDLTPKPYVDVQQALDDGFPRGMRNYWKATLTYRNLL